MLKTSHLIDLRIFSLEQVSVLAAVHQDVAPCLFAPLLPIFIGPVPLTSAGPVTAAVPHPVTSNSAGHTRDLGHARQRPPGPPFPSPAVWEELTHLRSSAHLSADRRDPRSCFRLQTGSVTFPVGLKTRSRCGKVHASKNNNHKHEQLFVSALLLSLFTELRCVFDCVLEKTHVFRLLSSSSGRS